MKASRIAQHFAFGLRVSHRAYVGFGQAYFGKTLYSTCPSRRVERFTSAAAAAWTVTLSKRVISVMAGSSNGWDVVDLTASPPTPRPREVANVDDEEEEDDDLELAIALSLQQHEDDESKKAEDTPASANAKTKLDSDTNPVEQKHGLGGLLGFDRKAMEAERLARLKRKRGEDEEEVSTKVRSISPQKVRSISPPALRRAPQKPVMPASGPSEATNTSVANTTSSSTISCSATSPKLYPDGVVLKTHAPGYATDRTISFSDLIAPAASLKSCLLSSFIWDFDWLLPHFSTNLTNFLLVMHAKYPGERQQIEANFAGIPNIKLCFPPMEGQVHCMHSKLMLLFWNDRCRIVVPTANLMGFDWGVGSVMENMVWLIDLPVLPEPGADGGHQQPRDGSNSGSETSFKRNLQEFLAAQTVPYGVLQKLDKFDFSKTGNVGFVHSISGTHSGENWKDTGHCGLGKAVKEMGLAHAGPIEVDFLTSSVGSLNDEFMRCMYLAAQGDDGLTEYTLRTAKAFPAKRIGTNTQGGDLVSKSAGQDWKGKFRFYFPSQQVVEASNGGERSAGTICFNEKWWEGTKFPKSAMQDCVSVREGLLMHNKVSMTVPSWLRPSLHLCLISGLGASAIITQY